MSLKIGMREVAGPAGKHSVRQGEQSQTDVMVNELRKGMKVRGPSLC